MALLVTCAVETCATLTGFPAAFYSQPPQQGKLAAYVRPQAESAHSATATVSQLVSLHLLPQRVTLSGRNATQRFLAVGKFADGLERDVTSESRFSISKPHIAKIDGSGRVSVLGDGTFVLTAEFGKYASKSDVQIVGSQEERPFRFAKDIVGILTKRGCNDSVCHGGVKGKGGFKLSFNGLNPREDYRWIVEGGTYQVLTAESAGAKTPRISVQEPEQSLLLLKPTFAIPHGGGERFKSDSSDYQAILNWVRSGAPYGEEGDAREVTVERIEVYPPEVVLDAKGSQQLLVTAYLSNGRQEDFTDQVLYVSINPEVVKVSPEGRVEAVKTGETAVIVRAAGQIASTHAGVIARPIPDFPRVASRNFIDEHVFTKLRKFNLLPSELSSDEEFLRRVCLDVTGTLPPPRRVREFLSSKDPRKRDRLIETLLNSPEYVDYWTYRFADVLRVNQVASQSYVYWEWIRNSIADQKPYDQMARERIAAQGADHPSRHYGEYNSTGERIVSEELRVFLGRRFDCAQCHNHPYETWSQDQFWGIAAFFGNLDFVGYYDLVFDNPNGGYGDKGQGGPVIHPRTKQVVQPTFLDGTELPIEKRGDPRLELAQWIISHAYFAEAAVNRIWSHFFSRGIVHPVDDFRSTNPPTNPGLLAALARDFRENGHDLKRLIRLIVQSRTYQLSSHPNDSNRDDEMNYSHAIPRALDAEVLLDAITFVSGVPEIFKHGVFGTPGAAPAGTRAISLKTTKGYPSRFLDLYGRPLRQVVPERDARPNLGQALHILAGSTYTDKLSQKGGRLDQLIRAGASQQEAVEELYLAALTRFPGEAERAEVEGFLRKSPSRRQALEDLLSALISSREFAYNH